MLSDVTTALACPVCSGGLVSGHGVLRCASGHSFDIAREGYVNLLTGGERASTADTPAMVAARRHFLSTGHFGPVTLAVVDAARDSLASDTEGVLVDAGGGTGEHLAALLDAFPLRAGVVLDASKDAAKIAARRHVRAAAVVADVWGTLPLGDRTAALVMSVFAPRNAEEFARVLTRGGTLLVVTPGRRHLEELVGPLGLITIDPFKLERLMAKLTPLFELRSERTVEYTAEMSRSDAVAAALMGPSAAHVSETELESRSAHIADSTSVTVSVTIMTFSLADDLSLT